MTTIQPIKNDQAVITLASTMAQSAAAATGSPVAGQQKTTEKSSLRSTSTEQKPDVATSGDSTSVFRLQAIQNETANRTAQAKAVYAASAVEEKLGEVKDALNGIVKNYPPFAMGDEKRIQYLMSISSVREQIEKMTVPPDPAKSEVNLMWSDLFKGSVPPLLEPYGPAEATDAQVGVALSTVSTIQAGLADRRSALEQQVASSSPVSAERALPLSQSAGRELAATQLPLTNRFSEALKGL